jgi:hypothetical protein
MVLEINLVKCLVVHIKVVNTVVEAVSVWSRECNMSVLVNINIMQTHISNSI